MSGHRVRRDLLDSQNYMADPGTGQRIYPDRWGGVYALSIAASASEVNSLSAPTRGGIRFSITAISVGSGGSRVITSSTALDAAGNTTMTFNAVDQTITLESVPVTAETFEWRVVHNEGVAGPTLTYRANLVQETKSYPIPLASAKVWDAPATNIPATPANDDLGLVYNTFKTGAPTIETGDAKATTVTRKTYLEFPVPPEYVAGQAITVRINAGMKTTVSDGTATVDLEVVRQAAPSTDICATAAQTINSLTAADKDFTITPTNVVPGDLLQMVITGAITDTATGTAVIGKINSVDVRMAVKG